MSPQAAYLAPTPLSDRVVPLEPVKSTPDYPYIWWWRKWRGDRKGHRCRILVRGSGKGGKIDNYLGGSWYRRDTVFPPRNILVEFEDGEKVVAPRFSVRKAK